MITILEKSARAAGAIAMSYFHQESHITHKTSHNDLVTAADVACQAIIRDTLTKELITRGIAANEIGFIGEEHLDIKGKKHSFIIDPLDGTNNFASGLDYFCVSIAHAVDGVPVESVIYWPSRDILYYAQAGSGAYKKIKGQSPIRLSVSDELLENCVIFTYISSQSDSRARAFAFMEKIYSSIRGIRIQGSLCLDLVHLCDNENSTHITLNFHAWLWDVAAGYLIVKESGGMFSDFQGNEMTVDYLDAKKQYSFIAAHPNVVKELKRYLS